MFRILKFILIFVIGIGCQAKDIDTCDIIRDKPFLLRESVPFRITRIEPYTQFYLLDATELSKDNIHQQQGKNILICDRNTNVDYSTTFITINNIYYLDIEMLFPRSLEFYHWLHYLGANELIGCHRLNRDRAAIDYKGVTINIPNNVQSVYKVLNATGLYIKKKE